MGEPRIGADDPDLAAAVNAAYDQPDDEKVYGPLLKAIIFFVCAGGALLIGAPFLAGALARVVWWSFSQGWSL